MFKSHRLLIVLLCCAALAATYSASMQRVELVSYNIMSRLLPETKQDSHVAVVALDQKSLTEIGDWPWPRQTLANLLAHINDAKPKAVGLMLPLDQAQQIKEQNTFEQELSGVDKKLRKEIEAVLDKLDPDPVLISALKKNNNVVLAVPYWPEQVTQFDMQANVFGKSMQAMKQLDNDSRYGSLFPYLQTLFMIPQQQLLIGRGPYQRFVENAAGVGLVQTGRPGDLIYREPLALPWANNYFPSFVLQLFAQYQKLNINEISVSPHQSVIVGTQIINTDNGNAVYPRIDTSGQNGIPIYSASDVLNNQVKKKQLADKAVLVGFTLAGFAPLMHAPGNGEVTPVHWAAQSLNSLINNDMIKVPDWVMGAQRGAIIVLALYLILLPQRLRGRLGFVASFIITLLLINTSLVLLLTQSMWLMLTLPALFVIAGHGLMTLHNHVVMFVRDMRGETYEAYIKLANFHQAQGKLDEAFDYFKKCPINESMLEKLYRLALDFERRRQFTKASSVYDEIALHKPDYKDIQERRERHSTLPTRNGKLTSTNPGMSATVVIDDPKIEKPLLGRYQLEEELGRGAMGMVYLGKDPTIGRVVAIKTLALSEEFEDQYVDEVRRRFFVEAETAGRLSHPNIVTIYDAGEEHDLAFIAMDYIKGDALNTYSRKGNLLPVDTVFEIGVKVAEALDYAHRQGVVHRDVKPGNIIYDKEHDTLKITDFGIACLTDNSKTRSGTVLGSPSYMSPEQLSGERVDGRSDLYSLGVTLYQLFTGVLPYQADSMAALAYKIMHDKPKGVRKERTELPICLTRIINKAMEKDPRQRYQDGVAMAEALQRCYEST